MHCAREHLAHDFAAWIQTTSLREIEMLVALIAAELVRRGMGAARAFDNAQTAIEQVRLSADQG